MGSNFFSIQFFFLACILLLVAPLSNCENAYYTACSALYSCGKIQDIGYPFWGEDRPKFCGIQDFKLSCVNNDTSFQIFKNVHRELSVHHINTSSHTMVYSLENLLNYCMLNNRRTQMLYSLVLSNVYNSTIRIFYGCDPKCVSKTTHYKKSFTCATYGDGTKAIAYYFGHPSDAGGIGKLCLCRNNVSLPAGERAYEELRSSNASLLSILTRQRIDVKYKFNLTACSKCEESGGRCGSSVDPSSYQFVCYCSDGFQPLVCPKLAAESQILAKKHDGRRKLAAIIGSGGFALVLGASILMALVKRAQIRSTTNKLSFLWSRRLIEDQNVEVFLQSFGSLSPSRYTYAELRKMTRSFRDKLGEGGYGSVYKGNLTNGRYVAVKILKILKGDGKEFINEMLSIWRTNHVNIVTLLGYCFEGNKRALVFEFMANGSLEKYIYGTKSGLKLQWETKFNIAIGIARGLDYLHRGCNTRILHFDIKPHNILLDEDYTPKISDFGLARLYLPRNSMISMSVARGTIGYIAPEVFCRNFGGVSHKSDVYSYGMMLLDLVCGRENTINEAQCSSDQRFPEWIYNRLETLEEGAVHEIMVDENNQELEKKMIMVSLWCIQTYPSNRPPMFRVVEMLEGPLESLQMPPKPNICSPTRSMFESLPIITT